MSDGSVIPTTEKERRALREAGVPENDHAAVWDFLRGYRSGRPLTVMGQRLSSEEPSTARRRMLHEALDGFSDKVRESRTETEWISALAADVDELVAMLPRVLPPRVETLLVDLIDAAVQRRVYGAF